MRRIEITFFIFIVRKERIDLCEHVVISFYLWHSFPVNCKNTRDVSVNQTRKLFAHPQPPYLIGGAKIPPRRWSQMCLCKSHDLPSTAAVEMRSKSQERGNTQSGKRIIASDRKQQTGRGVRPRQRFSRKCVHGFYLQRNRIKIGFFNENCLAGRELQGGLEANCDNLHQKIHITCIINMIKKKQNFN